MKIIRIKARVAPKPCIFIDYCIGACEWCESHEYSEACVPMLQKKVLDQRRDLIGLEKKCKKLQEGCEYCAGATFTEKPFTVITSRIRRDVQFHYCPNCGRKLEAE